MFIASVLVALLAGGAFAAYRVQQKKKRLARSAARRDRNRAYQRLWDMIMRRSTTLRLTDQREAD